MLRQTLFAVTSASALMSATMAYAQASTNADPNAALGEIVVTARQRSETLVSVPETITAFSSNTLEKLNIQSFSDYISKIPNLSFAYGQAGYGFSQTRGTFIRGVVGSNTTAYYIDDTPLPPNISPSVLDLDRIEVLKGPQGTLFGADSMGGNIRFISKAPSLTVDSGSAEVELGGMSHGASPDYQTKIIDNYVIAEDKLALHSAIEYRHLSGFITRTYPNGSGSSHAVDNQGELKSLSAQFALRAALTDRLEATLSFVGQDDDSNGVPATYTSLPAFTPESSTLNMPFNVSQGYRDRWALTALSVKYHGEGFDVTSSTSYFIRHNLDIEDGSLSTYEFNRRFYNYNNLYPLQWGQSADYNTFTHETRVTFDHLLLKALSGVAGVFYQDALTRTATGNGNTGELLLPGLAAAGLWPNDLLWYGRSGTHLTDIAAFGELYYEIVPRLTATVGLREYFIKQSNLAGITTGFAEGETATTAANSPPYQNGLIPKFVLSYKVTDNSNLYASASKGFREGLTGRNPITPVCAGDLAAIGKTLADTTGYQSDSLWSYELGAKISTGRISASASVFQINWSNIQQTVTLNCGVSFITNAGAARIRGAEFEVNGRPFPIPLDIRAGVGYLDPVITSAGGAPVQAGQEIYQVSRWTGTLAATYSRPISAEINAFASADYSYTGPSYDANVKASSILERAGYSLVNARLGLDIGRNEISIYGKNITNTRANLGDLRNISYEEVALSPTGANLGRRPRIAVSTPAEYGLQIKHSF